MHRSRLVLVLTLLTAGVAAGTIARADFVSYRVAGAVTSAATTDAGGNALDPSPVEREFTLGTSIELVFGYDPAVRVAQNFGANEAIYDAPFVVSGRIGGRSFSANAALVDVIDDTASFPGGTGDLLQFRIDPIFSGDYATLTDARIVEANPFSGTALRLDSFFVQFARRGGAAFDGTALPGTIDLGRYDANLFLFDYFDGSNVETTVLGNVGSIAPVPEPATLAVLGLGAVALLRRRRA